MKAYFDLAEGSPPPMRGKGQNSTVFVESEGITPAYAGKSHSKRTREKINGDHPRLCGEKNDFSGNDILGIGSPPPMRGKVSTSAKHTLSTGITPAYAGKSDFHDAHLRFFEDHPRLCGEKHILFIIGGDCMGITPAYAGKRCQRYYNFPVL